MMAEYLTMRWADHIESDPAICHGQPRIKGSRVMVSVVLDNLAAGEPPEVVASSYRITVEDVRAAIAYAAELAKERVLRLPGAA
jgi:uncharacterized protein (DUF433 family)